VEPGSLVDGRKIRHIAWPEDFIIARVKRDDEALFPRGNTEIRAGDVLLVVAEIEAYSKALGMCQTEQRVVG